jgi:hypothetical protein
MIACGEFRVCEGWKHNIRSMELGLGKKWNIHFSATVNLSMLYVGRLWGVLCDKMVSVQHGRDMFSLAFVAGVLF